MSDFPKPLLVQDVYVQGRRAWVRLYEKGGKQHEMPCHHNLETYLHAYLELADIAGDDKGFLFRTAVRRSGQLTDRPMTQADAYRMIRRRAAEAGILTRIGNHSFRATGITEYLKNGGKLEVTIAASCEDWLNRMLKRLRQRAPPDQDNYTAIALWVEADRESFRSPRRRFPSRQRRPR